MLGILSPHFARGDGFFLLQEAILDKKNDPGQSRSAGSPAEETFRLLPTHAGVRQGNSVLQTLGSFGWHVLPSLMQMTLQHQTQNSRRSGALLFHHSFPRGFLLRGLFARIGVTAVDHEPLGKPVFL